MASFGEQLKKIRKEKNLSLRETARRSKISHPYLSQLENGKRDIPTLEVIVKLAYGLDVEIDTLYNIAGYTDKRDTELTKNVQHEVSEGLKNLSNTVEKILEDTNLRTILANTNDNLRWGIQLLTIEDRQKIIHFIEKEIYVELEPVVIDIKKNVNSDKDGES